MAWTVRTEVNDALFAMVAGRLDTAARARMLGLLAVDPVRRRSDFDKVKDLPGAATISRFRKWLEHRAWLGRAGADRTMACGNLPDQDRSLCR